MTAAGGREKKNNLGSKVNQIYSVGLRDSLRRSRLVFGQEKVRFSDCRMLQLSPSTGILHLEKILKSRPHHPPRQLIVPEQTETFVLTQREFNRFHHFNPK